MWCAFHCLSMSKDRILTKKNIKQKENLESTFGFRIISLQNQVRMVRLPNKLFSTAPSAMARHRWQRRPAPPPSSVRLPRRLGRSGAGAPRVAEPLWASAEKFFNWVERGWSGELENRWLAVVQIGSFHVRGSASVIGVY